jgi:hypothetical protein
LTKGCCEVFEDGSAFWVWTLYDMVMSFLFGATTWTRDLGFWINGLSSFSDWKPPVHKL